MGFERLESARLDSWAAPLDAFPPSETPPLTTAARLEATDRRDIIAVEGVDLSFGGVKALSSVGCDPK